MRRPSTPQLSTCRCVASNTSGSSIRTAPTCCVEEPPVVQVGVGGSPVRQPVVLALVHLMRRAAGVPARWGTSARSRRAAPRPASALKAVLVAEDRHHDRPRASRCPTWRRASIPAVAQHGPTTSGWLRHRDSHVGGHDVDDKAQVSSRSRSCRPAAPPSPPSRRRSTSDR